MLRQFGRVQRMNEEISVRRIHEAEVNGRSSQRRKEDMTGQWLSKSVGPPSASCVQFLYWLSPLVITCRRRFSNYCQVIRRAMARITEQLFGFQVWSASVLFFTAARIGVRNCILISVGFMAFLLASLSTVAFLDSKHTLAMSPVPHVCNVLPIYGSIGMLPMTRDEEPNFQAIETIGKIIIFFYFLLSIYIHNRHMGRDGVSGTNFHAMHYSRTPLI